MPSISRRSFVKAGAAGALAAGAGPALGAAPVVTAPQPVKPVVIASANGHRYRNGGPHTCVEEAFARIVKGDDVLDALIAGVTILELDPEEDSVGFGGLPNAEGVVQLDASCMHGPRRRAGAVAALEGVRTPAKVAQAVMDHTDHHLLVGKGAQDFAREMGFTVEADLNTERSRRQWLEWKRRVDPEHWLDPGQRASEMRRVWREMVAAGLVDPGHAWGTINCNGITPKGEIAGVTTTSGLPWKIPGRVGDSAILGAGLYVDGEWGAAGSTGRGEANLYNQSSHLVVEGLRRGLHPKDAGMEALKRIRANTVEKRLLTEEGKPDFYVSFYILDRQGRYAGVDLYSSFLGRKRQFAVCTENGPQILDSESLLGDGPPAPPAGK